MNGTADARGYWRDEHAVEFRPKSDRGIWTLLYLVVGILLLVVVPMAVVKVAVEGIGEALGALTFLLSILAVAGGMITFRGGFTLNRGGLCLNIMVYWFTVWRRRWPVERVVRCAVLGYYNTELTKVAVAVLDGRGRLSWKDLSGWERDENSRWVADFEEVLRTLRMELGLGDPLEEIISREKRDSEMTRLADAEGVADVPVKPGGSRWEVRKKDGGLVFARPAVWDGKETLMALAYASMWTLAVFTLFLQGAIAPYDWVKLPLMLIGLGLMPVALYTACGFLGKVTARWRRTFYVVEENRLVWAWQQWDMISGQSLGLADCAAVEVYACDGSCPTVGPGKNSGTGEEFRVAFWSAAEERLAEMAGFSADDARWMRDEILSSRVLTECAPSPEEKVAAVVAETPAEVAEAAVAALGVWRRTENSLRLVKTKKTWADVLTACMAAGLTIFLVTIFYQAWGPGGSEQFVFSEKMPFLWQPVSHWDGTAYITLVILGFMTLPVLGMPIFMLIVACGYLTYRESWTLDENGFRYVRRALIPLRKYHFTLAEVLVFRAVEKKTHPGAGYDALVLKTSRGELLLGMKHFSQLFAGRKFAAAFHALAAEGNTVLARLKPAGAETLCETERPEWSRWVRMQDTEGMLFGKRRKIDVFRTVFMSAVVLLIGVFIAGVCMLNASLPAEGGIAKQEKIGYLTLRVVAVPMLAVTALWPLYSLVNELAQRFRWEVFGVRNGVICKGRRFRRTRWTEEVPLTECAEITITDRWQAPWAGIGPRTFCLDVQTACVLEIHGKDGAVLMEVPELALAEARWMKEVLHDYFK